VSVVKPLTSKIWTSCNSITNLRKKQRWGSDIIEKFEKFIS